MTTTSWALEVTALPSLVVGASFLVSLDKSLGEVLRHLLVVGERLGERPPSLCDRAQVEGEPQQLGLGHLGADGLGAVAGLGAGDLAAAPVQVAHDVAQETLGH